MFVDLFGQFEFLKSVGKRKTSASYIGVRIEFDDHLIPSGKNKFGWLIRIAVTSDQFRCARIHERNVIEHTVRVLSPFAGYVELVDRDVDVVLGGRRDVPGTAV